MYGKLPACTDLGSACGRQCGLGCVFELLVCNLPDPRAVYQVEPKKPQKKKKPPTTITSCFRTPP